MCLSTTTGGGDASCGGAVASLRCSSMATGAGVSCWAASLRCVGVGLCRSSATGAGVPCWGDAASVCCTGSAGAAAAGELSVKGCAGASSRVDGMAFESGDRAIQGMPRRDEQLGSKRSQSCLQAVAGESDVSALARTNSSRASGNNASTPTRLAKATREAEATKRKFEYTAHLLRADFRPPIRRKDNAAVAGLCPHNGPGPAELETVLNGQPRRKALCL